MNIKGVCEIHTARLCRVMDAQSSKIWKVERRVAWEINYPDCWPDPRKNIHSSKSYLRTERSGFHGKCPRVGEISRENSYVRFHAATRRPAWDAKRQIKKHIAGWMQPVRIWHGWISGDTKTVTISVRLSLRTVGQALSVRQEKKHSGWQR